MIFTPEEQQQINDTFAMMQEKIGEWAERKGWSIPEFGDVCSLFHSEISEAYEEHRNHHAPDEIYRPSGNGELDSKGNVMLKPEGIPIEFADLGIRMLHYFNDIRVNLGNCIVIKMDFNDLRSHRHGGKKV